MEHGFTLATRPSGTGELLVDLALTTTLAPTVDADARGLTFLDANGAAQLTYDGLVAFDTDGDHFPARLELVGDLLRFAVDDTGADYPLTIDPIVQQAYLKSPASSAGDWFGYAVDFSGDTLVVGAPFEDSGSAVDPLDDSAPDSGAVHVFVRSGSAWTEQAYLKAANIGADDQFGWSVDVSGDTLVVGAVGEDSSETGVSGVGLDDGASSSGAVYVFVRVGGVWSQQAYLKASNTGSSDYFGIAVALWKDTLVVGAPGEDSSGPSIVGDQSDNSTIDSGAAYVFFRTGGAWTQSVYLKESVPNSGGFFGFDVTNWGDSVVVGAPFSDIFAGNGGAAHVFDRAAGTWSHTTALTASNMQFGLQLGASVALSGARLVVGAPGETSDGSSPFNTSLMTAGAAYAFEKSGSTWVQSRYLKSPEPDSLDFFGATVSLDGDVAVIGALREDSASTGVGGAPWDDSVADSGAVFVFDLAGPTAPQYFKASNTGADDLFGSAVVVDGDTLVVGARGEASDGDGPGSDELDNSASGAGAAYVFDLDRSWRRLAGCGTNPAAWDLPTTPATIGESVDVKLSTVSVGDGVGAVYYGALAVDVHGCGLPAGSGSEFLLALSPFPTLLTIAPVVQTTLVTTLSIPANPAFVGFRVSLQAIAVDPVTWVSEISTVLEFEIRP